MTEDWKEILKTLTPDVSASETKATPDEHTDAKSRDVQKEPLKIIIDTKGRKGKTATIIEGFTCSDAEIEPIAKQLKNRLGCGGSVRDGEILIQGDNKSKVKDILTQMGFKVKG